MTASAHANDSGGTRSRLSAGPSRSSPAAAALMIQGSSSSVGKSLLAAALCRIFARRGVRVAPFKAQNMSNNAAVCPDGSEIGRAQALQALAAGIAPSADMNPVLIKPEADAHAQVVLNGRPFGSLGAAAYYTYKEMLWEHVTAALDRLRAGYELVIIEGAGSPAELNLKAGDIVNMAVARYANAPVLLAGDIDRGGIFAQLLGTLWLLEPEERRLVRGLLVNRFRGDPSLFTAGVRILEERSGLPVLGVIPYLKNLGLPEEDAVALDAEIVPAPAPDARTGSAPVLDIAVIRLPLISNFDDFDPLAHEPGVQVRYVHTAAGLRAPDAIILPGTKGTLADLEWLRLSGLAGLIQAHASRGGALVGVCGGYQMLGQVIHDPLQVESGAGSVPGLGLLPVETTFAREKATYQAQAQIGASSPDGSQAALPTWMASLLGQRLAGYEIHMGQTVSPCPWLTIRFRNQAIAQTPDGAFSPDGRIWGCYLHGLFGEASFRQAWLASLGWRPETVLSPLLGLDGLADAVEAELDMDRLEKIIWDD